MHRIPIKIRKPIHRDYCDCHSVKVVSVEGVPHLLLADGCTDLELRDFLRKTNVCVPIHITYNPNTDCISKLIIATAMGVPVTMSTNQALPDFVLEYMRQIPHSAIHVSTKFLDETLRNRLEGDASKLDDLRRMMFLAKSWKIFVGLQVDYFPHLLSKLDLYELIDIMKNCASHIFVRFPEVSDKDLHEWRHSWEPLMPSAVDRFKQYYFPYVPNRSWRVKNQYKTELMEGISEFIKGKRLGLELIPESTNEDRVRLVATSNMPFGMRPFFYTKVDDKFVNSTDLSSEEPCDMCGRTLFI